MNTKVRADLSDNGKCLRISVKGSRLKTRRVEVPKLIGPHQNWSMFPSSQYSLRHLVYSSPEKHHADNRVKITASPTRARIGSRILYLHFIPGRRDSITLAEFNQSSPNNDVPPLDTCIQFLEKRAKNVSLTKEIRTSSISTLTAPKSNGCFKKDHHDKSSPPWIANVDILPPNQYVHPDHENESLRRISPCIQD
ncbi:unnamed protein product [Allacma fusca]|uniref:Uncharacterized protein n=1 Tax=Allacma fusca TaxID=39272 RepID=A0A8J2KQ16_9HEXA|nr:unnamed protein product [Allacma fusca]